MFNIFREKKQTELNLVLDDLTALEQYIHDLFNFSPLPVCFISPIGVILEVNPALEKVTGFKMDEVIGESIEKIFDKDEASFLIRDTLKEGVVDNRELLLLSKGGNKIIAQVSTRVRKDENNETVGFFISLSDLTRIKKTEAELKRIQEALLNILEDTEQARKKAEEERNKTEAIIVNLTDGLVFFDRNHNLAMINPQAEKFFGVKAEDIVGENIKSLINSGNFALPAKFLGPEIKTVFRKELVLDRHTILEISTSAMGSEGEDLGDLVVFHDVSREKAVERLKTEFVSLAAHQLRTPLSAIKWSLRMVLDGDAGKIKQEQREILEKTYQSNERMISLINDLLNLSRIEEGRYVINPVALDLAKICLQVIESFKDSFSNKGLKFKIFQSSLKPIFVIADEEKLKLTVQNLLDNALKYTPAKGVVEVSLKQIGKNVRLEVRDTGIGIAKEEQGRIFSKFFRGSQAVLIEPTGTGLGLYMAKNIIEGHGGKIGFSSEQGKGSVFYFTLPKQKKGVSL